MQCVIDRQARVYVQQEFDIVNVNKNSSVFALFIEHVNWTTILRSDFDLDHLNWINGASVQSANFPNVRVSVKPSIC